MKRKYKGFIIGSIIGIISSAIANYITIKRLDALNIVIGLIIGGLLGLTYSNGGKVIKKTNVLTGFIIGVILYNLYLALLLVFKVTFFSNPTFLKFTLYGLIIPTLSSLIGYFVKK